MDWALPPAFPSIAIRASERSLSTVQLFDWAEAGTAAIPVATIAIAARQRPFHNLLFDLSLMAASSLTFEACGDFRMGRFVHLHRRLAHPCHSLRARRHLGPHSAGMSIHGAVGYLGRLGAGIGQAV